MTNARMSSSHEREAGTPAPALDLDLSFLGRFAGPLVLLARAMLAYIFIADGYGAIASFADVGAYMAQHGVSPALLPVVILTEIGGGLLILAGLKTRLRSGASAAGAPGRACARRPG